MYDGLSLVTVVVTVNGKIYNKFAVLTGVLQGEVFAPFLFILVMDYVMLRGERQFGFEYRRPTGTRSRGEPARRIIDLDFADDIVLLENYIDLANQQLESLRNEAERVGFEINTKKTEVMTFSIDHALSSPGLSGVYLMGEQLNGVNDFRYLGSMMGSTASDFASRRGLAWSAFSRLDRIWNAERNT